MDEYRQACSAKGIHPRRWIERALMQLPKNLKSVAFNFKAPEGEEDLTEAEYIILLQILFQKGNPTQKEANQGTRSLDPVSAVENQRNDVLPLESLELHGPNVTHAVLKELCLTHAGHECQLRSLLISGADLDCGVTDPLLWLSMSRPLRRSLRKLTIKNCKNLKIVDPCTWALFFGTVPLESLSIHNSGFDCNDFSFLCQVLYANESPSLSLKRLDIRVGVHKFSIKRSRTRYSDTNFVHIKRCLSKLTGLDSIKLDCVKNDQKLQLREKWKGIKGPSQCFIQSDELSTFLHLTIDLHIEEEEEMTEVVRFEQRSVVTRHNSSIDKLPSWKARAAVNFSNLCDHREIRFRSQTSSQRKAGLPSLNKAQDSQKTKKKRQTSRSRRLTGPPPKSKLSLVRDRSKSLLNHETNASSEEYDLEEELRVGPSPGGRTVIRETTKGKPDLVGYTHDGFIRPDDEMVYATSASEGEIERDLDTFQRSCEINISTSDSTLEKTSDQESLGTPTPTSLVDHSTQPLVVRSPDQSSKDCSLRNPTNGLQKELMELQPFYYDKRREKFKPGKILSDSAPAGAGSSGVTLRSGRRLGIETPSTVVELPEDTTNITDRLEMASKSKSVSCKARRINKLSLATTVVRNVARINVEAAAMDRNTNRPSPRDSKNRKRQSCEALRLQPWSWDPKYDRCPPNYQMYMTSKKKRRGQKNTH